MGRGDNVVLWGVHRVDTMESMVNHFAPKSIDPLGKSKLSQLSQHDKNNIESKLIENSINIFVSSSGSTFL